MQIRNSFKISLLVLLIGCKSDMFTQNYYYTVSLEDNGEISTYTKITRTLVGDTLKLNYKDYNSTTYKLLSKSNEIFIKKGKLLFWAVNIDGEKIYRKPLYSSMNFNKCDTSYFKTEKIINCYQGKQDVIIKGICYKNVHMFFRERRNINNDFIKSKTFYDNDMIPLLIVNIAPESRIFRMERIDKIPKFLSKKLD